MTGLLSRWAPWVAGGAVVGALLRRLPLAAAERMVEAGDDSPPVQCGDRSALECALDNVGSVGEIFVTLLVYVIAASALLGLAGAVLVVVGAVRKRPVLVGAGVAVAIPGAWQLAGLGLAAIG